MTLLDTNDCAGAILFRDGFVLLGKRAANAPRFPGLWDVLGGRRLLGEGFAAALGREMEEEAGVTPTAYRELGSFAIQEGSLLKLYLVTEWDGGEPQLLGGEHSELRWFRPEEAAALPDLVAAELRKILLGLTGAHDCV